MRTRHGTWRTAAVPVVTATGTLVLCGWFAQPAEGLWLQLQVLSCWFAVAVFASMMSYFSFRVSRRMQRADPRRRFWTALGFASSIFAAGEWAQLVTVAADPSSVAALTGTGVARTFALGAGCAVIAAVVLTYPIPHRSARERMCYLLDVATVVTAAGTLGLYWTLASMKGDQSITAGDLVSVAIGPVAAIVTAFAVGRLHLSRAAPFTWPLGVLGPFAAVVEVLARVLGPRLVETGRPGVIFMMTVASHALLMIAARARLRSVGSKPDRRRRSFSLLPYAALWTTFALLVATVALQTFDVRVWVSVSGLAATIGFVMARQLTSMVGNEELLVERDALAARLHTMAFTDSLTGLGNRALFVASLNEALKRDGEVGVLLIDLDDFKPVNDKFGHAAGDAVLVQTAGRLRVGVGPSEVIARLGGDEFAVLLERTDPDRTAAVAQRVVHMLGETCRLDGGIEVRVCASVGAATAGRGRDASALLHAADEAMYAAKNSQKGSFRLAHAT